VLTNFLYLRLKNHSRHLFQGHRNGVYGVCFQPVGHLVATASFDFTAKLWDTRSAEDIQTLRGHQEDVIGVDIDDSGTLLATGSDDKTCRVWDLRMGSPLTVLKEHSGEVKRVAFSPFGKLLATTSGDTTARLYNTSTFDCVHVLRYILSTIFEIWWH
jgi:dynein assembly factor with WDR repeat domains 1